MSFQIVKRIIQTITAYPINGRILIKFKIVFLLVVALN